jgi:hypothetical protein
MDASGRLFQREGDGATTLLAIVDRLPCVFCLQIVISVLLDFVFLIVQDVDFLEVWEDCMYWNLFLVCLVRICGRIDGGDGLWLWRIPCGDKKQKLKKTLVRLDTVVFFFWLFLKLGGVTSSHVLSSS